MKMNGGMLRSAGKQRGRPFPKGRSGNPGGRPKKTPELVEVENLCREHSPAAVKRLAEWMASDEATASVRACQGILERAFGKPRQPLEHTGKDGGAIETSTKAAELDLSRLNADERAHLRELLLRATKQQSDRDADG